MTLYKQKLLEFSNGDEPTNNFTTNFNPPLVIDEDSLIAMQMFSMELLPESIIINDDNNKYGFAIMKPSAKTYQSNLEEHTITLKNGTYNSADFALLLNEKLNSTMHYNKSNYTEEQGCEVNVSISDDKKMSIDFAFSLDTEYSSPDTDQVKYSTSSYTYSIDPTYLDRIGIIINKYNKNELFFTDNIFCRGSGIMSMYDGASRYRYEGTFVDGGDNNTIFMLVENDITLDEFGYKVGDEISFYNSGTHIIDDLSMDANGHIEITINSELQLINDFLVVGNRCSGFVFGLIRSENISTNDPFQKIEFGLCVLPDGNDYGFDGGWVYSKIGADSEWIPNAYVLDDGVTSGKDERHIGFILGKLDKGDDYKINMGVFNDEQSGFLNGSGGYESFNYSYGEYRMVCGMMTQGYQISNIIWTESKLSKQYVPPPPLDDLSIMLAPDNGFGFFPKKAGYVTFDFFNSETSLLCGYFLDKNVSENVIEQDNLIVKFMPNKEINTLYGLPESIRVSIDIPLESYSRGVSSRCISYIPNNQVNVNPILVYSPPEPTFLSLNNLKKMYLDHITFRLENGDGELASPQSNCTIVLLLRSKYI